MELLLVCVYQDMNSKICAVCQTVTIYQEAATIFSYKWNYKCLKCQKHIGINSIATQYYTGLMIKSLKPWFGIPIIAIDYFSLFNYEM